jgi:hypothetical protein
MPGIRKAFKLDNGSQWVVGVGVPIGVTRTAPEVGAFLYTSFEHSFFRKDEVLQ